MGFVDFDSKKQNKNEAVHVREKTVARTAEETLDELLYDGQSGLYRDHQFVSADTVTLQTTYEEIFILWECQAVYRQGFSVENNVVHLPVLFVNIAGVDIENVKNYWKKVDSLVVSRTCIIDKSLRTARWYAQQNAGGMQTFVDAINWLTCGWYKNGRLQRNKISQHPSYRYGHLNVDLQNRIFDKLQLLLDSNLIKKTKHNNEMNGLSTLFCTNFYRTTTPKSQGAT
ncbi:MAG: YceG family protein [Bacillota bacterium]